MLSVWLEFDSLATTKTSSMFMFFSRWMQDILLLFSLNRRHLCSCFFFTECSNIHNFFLLILTSDIQGHPHKPHAIIFLAWQSRSKQFLLKKNYFAKKYWSEIDDLIRIFVNLSCEISWTEIEDVNTIVETTNIKYPNGLDFWLQTLLLLIVRGCRYLA